jgi:hypothetical protein
MNDGYAGGSRTAEDRPEQADGPGGWWQADDGYWYPPRDPSTTPVTMVETGWGGNGGPPRAPGMIDTFRGWPLWARVGVPVLAGLFVLGGIGAAVGEPEESDGTEIAASEPTTTAEPSTTTTSRPTTTTTEPTTTTTAPPTTTTTARPTTTAPPTTAAPPPPPTTAAPPATMAPAPPQPACHPSYSGCVPTASDVDCSGGSGDGPEYVSGPVQVLGSDPYGLDNDNDGVGCES